MIKLKSIKQSPDNPRLIKNDSFKRLVESIRTFPKMMELRPLIVDENNVILGGNMRYRALLELKYKEIPDEWVKRADELTEDQKKEFMIKDNVSFGEWNFDTLANEWDDHKLYEWGMNLSGWQDDDQSSPSGGSPLLVVDDTQAADTPPAAPKASATSDEYSVYEQIMLHENKLELLELLNAVKQDKGCEKLEDALMEIVKFYKSQHKL